MSELHFIPDKEKIFKQILIDREYASLAYMVLKEHQEPQPKNSGSVSSMKGVSQDVIYGVRDLLEVRGYLRNEGMHYMITKEGVNHLGELERKIR